MDHDELCYTGDDWETFVAEDGHRSIRHRCRCDLIATVRANERRRFDDDGADRDIRIAAIHEAANEAALALMAMDGIEFTPEQHNSGIDAIHALLEEKQ